MENKVEALINEIRNFNERYENALLDFTTLAFQRQQTFPEIKKALNFKLNKIRSATELNNVNSAVARAAKLNNNFIEKAIDIKSQLLTMGHEATTEPRFPHKAMELYKTEDIDRFDAKELNKQINKFVKYVMHVEEKTVPNLIRAIKEAGDVEIVLIQSTLDICNLKKHENSQEK